MTALIEPKNPHRWKLHLKEWRKSHKLTQEALAERLGADKVTISRIETGKRSWNSGFLFAVAEALGVEPVDLFRAPDAIGARAKNRSDRINVPFLVRIMKQVDKSLADELIVATDYEKAGIYAEIYAHFIDQADGTTNTEGLRQVVNFNIRSLEK